jgi:hypothetical protein
MNYQPDPVSAIKYDAVVRLLTDEPELSHSEVARRCEVGTSTVARIWTGAISRPSVVVLDRLSSPQRCPECGALCRDWPCIFCEMGRHQQDCPGDVALRFQYRNRCK